MEFTLMTAICLHYNQVKLQIFQKEWKSSKTFGPQMNGQRESRDQLGALFGSGFHAKGEYPGQADHLDKTTFLINSN
jgi:regulator of replication initiation timing